MADRTTRKMRSALNAARRGWPVLALHWIVSGHCSCRKSACSSPRKHPLLSGGVKNATADLSRIRKLWTKWPEANVGIATGRVSGIVVLDIDPRHGGTESLGQLKDNYGQFPDGPRVRTGGNGDHVYFRCPNGGLKNRVSLLPGIDIRGDGAYVVGANSIHVSGARYLFVRGQTPEKRPLPPVPDWLLKLIQPRETSSLKTESRIPEGQRNATLASLAGSMRARGMTRQAIEAALLEENRLRCDPPLNDTEVLSIAASIARYLPNDREILSASYKDEVPEERKLTFHTGEEIANEAPPSQR